jgi:hypothetical protein
MRLYARSPKSLSIVSLNVSKPNGFGNARPLENAACKDPASCPLATANGTLRAASRAATSSVVQDRRIKRRVTKRQSFGKVARRAHHLVPEIAEPVGHRHRDYRFVVHYQYLGHVPPSRRPRVTGAIWPIDQIPQRGAVF